MDFQQAMKQVRNSLTLMSKRVFELAEAVAGGSTDRIASKLSRSAETLSGLSESFSTLSRELTDTRETGEPPTEYMIELEGAQVVCDRPILPYTHLPNRYAVPTGTRVLRVVNDESRLSHAPRDFAVDFDFAPDGTFPADWGIPFHEVDEDRQPSSPVVLDGQATVLVYTRRTAAERTAANESSDESYVHDVAAIHATDDPSVLAPPLYAKAYLQPYIDVPGLELWVDQLAPVTLDSAKAVDAINSLGLLIETAPGWTQRYTHAAAQVPEYGRDIAELVGNVGLALHDKNIPKSKRMSGLYRLLQVGIDAHGNLRARRQSDGREFSYEADGGHGNGRYYPYMLAAELLGLPSVAGSKFSEIGQTYEVTPSNEQARAIYDWRMRPGLHTNRAAVYPAGSAEEKAEKYRVLAANSIVSTLVPMTLQDIHVDHILRSAMQSHIEWQRGMGLSGAYGLAETYLDNIDDQILDY